MENTLENKAKFFAQYFGRTFITGIGGKSALSWIDIGYISLGTLSATLELKDMSNISPEDINYIIILLEIDKQPVDNDFLAFNKSLISYINYLFLEKKDIKSVILTVAFIHAVDYLRSKGYALPYMGLSVEKQVEYGWIKLKSV